MKRARERWRETGVKLGPLARLAYLEICGFPEAYVSNAWLAGVLDCKETAARDALVELEEAGLIRRIARPGRTNVIRVFSTPPRQDEGGPPRHSEGDPPATASPKQEEKQERRSKPRPPVDSPRGESPDVAPRPVVPDNPPASLESSSSSTSSTGRASGLDFVPSRGVLISGPRKAFALPADLEAELAQRFTEAQRRALRTTLGKGPWAGKPDLACMAARVLLERPGVRDPERYVGQLVDAALERLTAPISEPPRPPPPKVEPHRDDVQIATLKRRIAEAPLHPRRAQYEGELRELELRRAERLGQREAS